MSNEVIVFSKSQCPQCDFTKKTLSKRGVAYRERDIETDVSARDHVLGLGYRSVPVVVAGETHWSGFQPDLLNQL